ncbi:MAG: disulfide isomerase DsbC N-terminal domain-containing protein, partial [Thermodesulfobacteriota bacterium]
MVIILFILSLIASPYIATAGNNDCLKSDSEVGKTIKEILPPNARINNICPSAIKGVYELVVDDMQIVYFDPVSRTIILGMLIQDGVDLTKKRQAELGLLPKPDKRQAALPDKNLEK